MSAVQSLSPIAVALPRALAPVSDFAAEPLTAATAVAAGQWDALVAGSVEPNAFLDRNYLDALLTALAPQRPTLLVPMDGDRPQAVLPVAWALKARGLPVPALVTPQPYLPLGGPLLDGADAFAAAGALLDAARTAGALALVIDKVVLGGPVANAFEYTAEHRGVMLRTSNVHERAALDCTGDAEAYLRAGLGGKKLKEYRRLANRLADEGEVATEIASTPATIVPLLEAFLVLEAAGWKGARGTGIAQSEAHAEFIRTAIPKMAAEGRAEVIAITLDHQPIAAGIVLYQRDTALFFKIAYNEAFARYSPGVQLTLELTRHLFARPDIRFADSTADANHPMIDHIWRERLTVADLAIATRRSAAAQLVISAALGRDALRARAKSIVHRFTPAPRRAPEIVS